MRRILTGLGAVLLLALLLAGLPFLLIAIGPIGLPHIEPTLAGVWAALLRPDDGTLFLSLIKAAGWIVWALLALSVLAEVIAQLRHLPAPTLRGLAISQGLARGLVAAVVALFLNTNSTLAAPAPANAQPIPAAAPAVPSQSRLAPAAGDKAKPAHEQYTVKKGDILSQLALDHLGNAQRYPEIFNASQNIRQPGGARLVDPDEIDIGWTLTIPIRHAKTQDTPAKAHEPKRAAPEPPIVTGPPTTAMPSSPASVPATPAPATDQPSTTTTQAETAADEATAEAAQPPWLLAGLAGAGAVLAGSLWLVLLRRRAVQHHHRRPGFVTAPPPPQTLPVEKTLRYQGQPAGDLLTFVDDTLRRLAVTLIASNTRLPVVLAVEATLDSIRLRLAEQAALPEPWQQGETANVWGVAVADLPDDLEPLEPDGPAPWPHLATIGADDTGHWWLLNLETAGITAIGGDTDYASDLARYLAAELATTPWSRDIQVDLIGIFDELAGLDPRRLRHRPNAEGIDDTIGAAVDTVDRLNRLQVDDLPAARAQQAGDEIWLNRVLVTTGTAGHFDHLAQLVHDQPSRTAVAALIVGAATAPKKALSITVGADGRARIPALGLNLIANGITPDEARGCVQLLQAAEHLPSTEVPAQGGDGWRQHADEAGRLRPELTEPRNPDGNADPATTNLPQPDNAILAIAATTSDDLATLAPTIPEHTGHKITDPDLDEDLADWLADTTDRPRLSVLGAVKVRVGKGGEPAEAAKRRPYYTELVAYLASRPKGATTEQLCVAFAATPARIQRDLGVVRKWLGTNPTTREQHLPEAARSVEDPGSGPRTYRLHRVLCDTDLFRRLRVRGQAAGVEGLEDYLRALALVTGSPYLRLRAGGGIWLSDNRDDQHLLVAIVDTAHVAVTMALQDGDLDAARSAAKIAAAVAPDEEVPKLDLAAVAEAAGDRSASAGLVEQALRQRDSDGPIELGTRSTRLLTARGWSSSKVRSG